MSVLVFIEVADVAPVAVGDIPVEPDVLPEEKGEEVLAEVVFLAVGDELEDVGLQDVYAGVDRVAENFSPRRLLEEPGDFAVMCGDHDSELERVLRVGEDDRRPGSLGFVETERSGQIEIGQDVSADHQYPFPHPVRRIPDAPRGPVVRFRPDIAHRDAE